MHPNPTVDTPLELVHYGRGYALLRPEQSRIAERFRRAPKAPEPQPEPTTFIPRDRLPRFIIRSQTHYLVFAETASQALEWFADNSNTDVDVETLDFGQVTVIHQIDPECESASGRCRACGHGQDTPEVDKNDKRMIEPARSVPVNPARLLLRSVDLTVAEAIADHEGRYHRGQVPLDTLENLQAELES